mmetsp:Transcript_15361/g.14963  ORF Transcript_15361/g.14963 Transcript_15361/m.14963 type:complete len:277 (-) Transcript_15361:2170-3000(-)|eukprot:CAMPEP_0170565608 /NCGR_PEP_ID=MMETSP0211-20121228/79298_1 /TAXON_ID=311385 /ORGANISM="Pseudokeronopsis sp., Strain OXSARD2" /LENGTH=276 /DNA_ID=CAMNT_0010886527 /DNA_START=1125 /DNA_END=1955 /DNA_ORIENTATION=-
MPNFIQGRPNFFEKRKSSSEILPNQECQTVQIKKKTLNKVSRGGIKTEVPSAQQSTSKVQIFPKSKLKHLEETSVGPMTEMRGIESPKGEEIELEDARKSVLGNRKYSLVIAENVLESPTERDFRDNKTQNVYAIQEFDLRERPHYSKKHFKDMVKEFSLKIEEDEQDKQRDKLWQLQIASEKVTWKIYQKRNFQNLYMTLKPVFKKNRKEKLVEALGLLKEYTSMSEHCQYQCCCRKSLERSCQQCCIPEHHMKPHYFQDSYFTARSGAGGGIMV